MKIVTLSEYHQFSTEKLQKVALFESDYLFYDLYCLEPGQKQKVHRHEGSDKIYLALEGRPTIQIGEERAEQAPGQAVMAPEGVDHGVLNDSGERAVLLVVMAPKP